uniref:Uncharacterized protein n=1 Tax=Poecilia latipinna TaxID=48699 RepID=A0A3B3TU04_9TELE
KKTLYIIYINKLFVSSSAANPVIREKFAKQLLRSKRQDRPVKAGHPDEPMRVRQETRRAHGFFCFFLHWVAVSC